MQRTDIAGAAAGDAAVHWRANRDAERRPADLIVRHFESADGPRRPICAGS
jgi:hypothetical protein